MVKRRLSRKEISKVIAFVVVGTIMIFAVVAFLVTRGTHAPSAINQDSDGTATIEGLAVCLPHRNTDGPQTLECAIGIRDDKGIYYSLGGNDTSMLIETGKRYKVSGNIEERADTRYQTAGVVRVKTIQQL